MNFDGNAHKDPKHIQFLMMNQKHDNRNYIDNYQNMARSVMFAQINAKKGIKIFGERTVATMPKEFLQMNEGPMSGKTVFGSQHASKMTPPQKKNTLEAINLIKEKRDANGKGHTCAY